MKMRKCTCGGEKANTGHSDWCDSKTGFTNVSGISLKEIAESTPVYGEKTKVSYYRGMPVEHPADMKIGIGIEDWQNACQERIDEAEVADEPLAPTPQQTVGGEEYEPRLRYAGPMMLPYRGIRPPAGESSAEMLQRLGTDAQLWAKEFHEKILGEIQNLGYSPCLAPDSLIGWFANAIMAGYDQGYRRGKEDEEMTRCPVSGPDLLAREAKK